MKRMLMVLLVLCLLSVPRPAPAESAHEVLYFYESYCESCTPEADFASDFRALTGINLEQCAFEAHNIASRSGQEALTAAQRQYDIDAIALPLAIVDGAIYAGADALNRDLPETALTWQKTTDSVILYLYVPACESCARAAEVLDSLPDAVSVRRGGLEFESAVRVEKIDASADQALAGALFDAYEVPDERRIVPSVFFSDRCLSGIDEIERDLALLVRIGRASGGTLPVVTHPSKGESSNPAIDIPLTLIAGLIAGTGPCGLFALLLYRLSKQKTGRLSVKRSCCFLTSEFMTFLLLGFALLSALQLLDPDWLRPLERWTIAIAGLAFACMSLWNTRRSRKAHRGGTCGGLSPGTAT